MSSSWKTAPPGYPTTIHTNWKFAAEDVKDAEPANCPSLAMSRTLHSTLQVESSHALAAPTSALSLAFADPNSKPGPKRPREEECKVKSKWSKDDLAKPYTHSFWTGNYTELAAECKNHGVSQSGSLQDMLKRLRTHCQDIHPVATRRAKTGSISSFFKPKS